MSRLRGDRRPGVRRGQVHVFADVQGALGCPRALGDRLCAALLRRANSDARPCSPRTRRRTGTTERAVAFWGCVLQAPSCGSHASTAVPHTACSTSACTSLPTYSGSSLLVTHAQSARRKREPGRARPCDASARCALCCVRTSEGAAARRPRAATQVAGAHEEHGLLGQGQVRCRRVSQEMHVQASRRLREGALRNLQRGELSTTAGPHARRARPHAEPGHTQSKAGCDAACLPHGLARVVHGLRELPLPACLAHNKVQEVLRLALGGSAQRRRHVSAAPSSESARRASAEQELAQAWQAPTPSCFRCPQQPSAQ